MRLYILQDTCTELYIECYPPLKKGDQTGSINIFQSPLLSDLLILKVINSTGFKKLVLDLVNLFGRFGSKILDLKNLT